MCMCCVFEDLCVNNGSSECDTCHFNPYACTQDHFEWNGTGNEPTPEELEDEIQN